MSSRHQSKISKTKPRYLFTILSMALTLFILGGFALFLVSSQTVIRYFKENVELIVELTPDSNDASQQEVEQLINSQSFIKPESLHFISKEEGAVLLQNQLEEDFITLDIGNPLTDIFTFNVQEAFMTPDSLSEISDRLTKHPHIAAVFYEVGTVEGIHRNLNRLGLISGVLVLIFLMISIASINGTVRLAMYSDRFLIKNMQLVGAEWAYIRKPYLQKSTLNGIISGLIAAVILMGLLYWATTEIPDLQSSFNTWVVSAVLGGLVVLGGLIAYLAAYKDINQYLKMKLEDLY